MGKGLFAAFAVLLLGASCALSPASDGGADGGCRVMCPGPDSCGPGEHVTVIFICTPRCQPAGCCPYEDCTCVGCMPNDAGDDRR